MLQCAVDGLGEFCEPVWFVQQDVFTDFEVFFGKRIFGEARGVNRSDLRLRLGDEIGKLDPVQAAGHDDVGDHQVNAGMFVYELQGVRPILRK